MGSSKWHKAVWAHNSNFASVFIAHNLAPTAIRICQVHLKFQHSRTRFHACMCVHMCLFTQDLVENAESREHADQLVRRGGGFQFQPNSPQGHLRKKLLLYSSRLKL